MHIIDDMMNRQATRSYRFTPTATPKMLPASASAMRYFSISLMIMMEERLDTLAASFHFRYRFQSMGFGEQCPAGCRLLLSRERWLPKPDYYAMMGASLIYGSFAERMALLSSIDDDAFQWHFRNKMELRMLRVCMTRKYRCCHGAKRWHHAVSRLVLVKRKHASRLMGALERVMRIFVLIYAKDIVLFHDRRQQLSSPNFASHLRLRCPGVQS